MQVGVPGARLAGLWAIWGAFLEDGVLAEGRPIWLGLASFSICDSREYGLGQGCCIWGNGRCLSWGQRKNAR